ncbi:MAG: Cys-tRNA(Pro) deacylase [Bacillota bacterium]|nr:Cys-tRNA(Pro) deacylase [Bacillota bacterium]
MSEKINFKTNAIRILESEKINYILHKYDHDEGFVDGVSVASKLGEKYSQVFKTIVTKGASNEYFVFVLPVDKEINLKAAARVAGEKSVDMIKVSDITKITGYIRGGCSPIGMKKKFKTVIDSSCLDQKTIIVSAGKIGYQMELDPQDLIRAADCIVESIT